MPNGTINATFNANCADIYNKSKVASDGKIIIFDLASNQGEELMYKWILFFDVFFVQISNTFWTLFDKIYLQTAGQTPRTPATELPPATAGRRQQ